MDRKRCSRCETVKPADAFHKMAQSPDGLRPECKECRKADTKAYCERNAERQRERSAAWRRLNPERSRAATADWKARNHQHKLEYDRAYHREHREERLVGMREYQKANPQHARNQRARRRAQMGATVNCITRSEWEGLKASYHGLCVYCNDRPETMTLDHLEPLNRGGDHTVENIVPSCARCNREKSDKSLLVYLATRGPVGVAA